MLKNQEVKAAFYLIEWNFPLLERSITASRNQQIFFQPIKTDYGGHSVSVSDFDFSFLEVMNKNFLINVTLKLGLNKFETRNSLAGVPLYHISYMHWNTYQKQAIHLNSKLIVKLVLDVRNIFQSKWNFSFQKYEYNLFYRQQLIFRHRN